MVSQTKAPTKYWVTYIKGRIKRHKNFLGFISGQTGSGKSYCSLRIGEECDPKFDISRVVFSGIELMTLINSGKLKRGSCIVFEEMGVEANNKNWNSTTNKMLNFLMQTFRYKGFIIIMNSPFMDFVDSSTRKLFHAEFSTVNINLDTKEVVLKPHLIQYNSRQQKFYYKRLKVVSNGMKMPIDYWNVGLPSKELLENYDEKKNAYSDKLNKKIMDELQKAANPDANKEDKRYKNVDMVNFAIDVKAGMSINTLCAKYDCAIQKCAILKAKVELDQVTQDDIDSSNKMDKFGSDLTNIKKKRASRT